MGTKKKQIDTKELWFDKEGRQIDDAYIAEFEPMLRGQIMEFFADKQNLEEAMDYEDLLQEGRLHIRYALHSFDPHKAIYEITKDDSKKKMSDEEYLAYKVANKDEVLKTRKDRWVRTKIKNEFRRDKWESSAQSKGGSTEAVPWNEILEITPEAKMFCSEEAGLEALNVNMMQARLDVEHALELGDEGKAYIMSLDQERREDALNYLKMTVDRDPSAMTYILQMKKDAE